MKRWTAKDSPKPKNLFGAAKRGAVSLAVCAIVLLPLGLTAVQIWHLAGGGKSDPRKAVRLPAMRVRPIDRDAGPVVPFKQPLITVTFDDGWESVYTSAMPITQKYGIPTTQYVLSGTVNQPSYMSVSQIKSMRQAGHEIGCHTVGHKNLTTLDQAGLLHELTACKAFYESNLGTPVIDFASPYGANDAQTLATIARVYRSQRNTDGDITTNGVSDADVNMPATFARYSIIAVSIRRETTIAELQSAIDFAVRHDGWLVLNYHDVTNDSSRFGVDPASLDKQLAVVSAAKSRIVTMGQVLDAMHLRAPAPQPQSGDSR